MGLGGGEEFAGYRVERELARGGMGIVYVARDVELDRLVALKVLGAAAVDDEEFRRRFRLESRTAAAIDHPNVVGVHEAREHEGELYIAMQYVPGRDLKTEIRRVGRLEPELAAEVISQAADGLDAVHAAGLIHRDVKPANILLHTPDTQVRALITDFGIARAENPTTQMTATGLFVGTLDYVSPEQLQGHSIDARSDVYALGCALYEAVSGVVPFPDVEGPAKMFGHVHGPRPQLDPALGRLVLALQPVIERAMAQNPEERFPSAGDLGRAAQAAAAGVPPPPQIAEQTVAEGAAAPPPPPQPRPPPPAPASAPAATSERVRPATGRTVPRVPAVADAGRRRWPFVLAATASLAVAVAVAAFVLLNKSEREDGPPAQSLTTADALWQAGTGGPVKSTPALNDGELIVGSDSNSVFAFGASDGGELWRFPTEGEVRSSPVLADGKAIVGSFDGSLYAIDAESGEVVWDAPTNSQIFSSPAVSGSTVVVGAHEVKAVDSQSGAELWTFRTRSYVNSSPAIDAGVVYVGDDRGFVHAIDLVSGEGVWSKPVDGPIISSPAVSADTVYVGGARGLSALAIADGEERWSSEVAGGVNSSPLVVDGRIVFGGEDGSVYSLDEESGERGWSFDTGDSVNSSPAVANGIVYIGSSDGTVYGIDFESGADRWRFDAGSPVVATPVVSDGVVYVASDAGSLFALPAYEG